MTFHIELTRQAKRALAEQLPESVAVACHEFIHGPLAENPYKVSKRLREPHYPSYVARRGEFRIIYDIADEQLVVFVINIRHRRDVYRNLN